MKDVFDIYSANIHQEFLWIQMIRRIQKHFSIKVPVVFPDILMNEMLPINTTCELTVSSQTLLYTAKIHIL